MPCPMYLSCSCVHTNSIFFRMTESKCALCGCTGASKQCSRCTRACYCTAQCQRKHWPVHKKVCVPYNDPSLKEIKIAWKNMEFADKNLLLRQFCAAYFGWFKHNKDKTFADLERELRKRNFNTHLFAVPCNNFEDIIPVHPGTYEPTGIVFECMASCRPRQLALLEARVKGGSEQQNLLNLERAGVLFTRNIDTIPTTGEFVHMISSQIDENVAVANNAKKLY